MKVYVDKLPKSCAKCDRFCLDEKGRFRCILNSMPDYRSQEEKENNRRNDCPLQSLSDHDKLVRKEVCEELREWARNQIIYCGGKATETDILTANASNQVLYDLKEFLDQIQGETK